MIIHAKKYLHFIAEKKYQIENVMGKTIPIKWVREAM